MFLCSFQNLKTDEEIAFAGNWIHTSRLLSLIMKELNLPQTIAECKVDKKQFMSKVSELADKAFEDQCTPANPRMPLVKELENIYITAFDGKTSDKKQTGSKALSRILLRNSAFFTHFLLRPLWESMFVPLPS